MAVHHKRNRGNVKNITIIILGVVVCLHTLSAAAPLIHQTFEFDSGGWIPFGAGSHVRITHTPAEVKTGDGSLAFDYDAAHSPSLAVFPVRQPLGAMRSLSFWLKTDAAAPISVLLNENEPGGRYMSVVWSPANTWQYIALRPSDFVLNEGPADPRDPDNRLDTDRLHSIGLLDLSQILGPALKSADLPIAVDLKTGKHSFFLDDFEVSADALPAPKADPDGIALDPFDRPFLQWFTLGGAELSYENHGMRVRYVQEADRYPIFSKILPPLDLRGWNRLAFDISSEQPAQLVLSLEEHNPGKARGPRYSTTVEVSGGGKVDHRAVVFSAFTADPNGPADADGLLNLDQIKVISILDITGATASRTAANSLWIGNIHVSEKSR